MNWDAIGAKGGVARSLSCPSELEQLDESSSALAASCWLLRHTNCTHQKIMRYQIEHQGELSWISLNFPISFYTLDKAPGLNHPLPTL